MSRCGIVVLAGRPNAGKSTLLNALVGEPLAIISPKPQTTRVPVRGLLSDAESQIIFVDPAGLMDPGYPLQRGMRRAALEAVHDADVVVHVHPLPEAPAPRLEDLIGRRPAKVVLAYTKADMVPEAKRPPLAPGALAVSGTTGEGVSGLLAAIRAFLPEGPFLYDADDVGTQPLRFFAAEFVREAVYAALREELPYSVAVEIDEFREGEDPVYIRAVLAVERESQKPIVLGKGGRTIRAIGTAARERIAAFLDRRVYLDLWVTVWPRWRRDPAVLARLGLPLPPETDR
ncbi:MAG: GTPase Era [Gemmatimonadales bacterium]|jgi:GTP-binding protein Era